MERKLIILASMLLLALGAKAQQEEGTLSMQFRGGLSLATFDDADKWKAGLCLGADLQYMVTDYFGLSAGVTFSQQGGIYNDEEYGKETVTMDFVNVPLMAEYYVLPGLALKAGIQPGFNMKTRAKQDGLDVDIEQLFQETGVSDFKLNKFDLAVPVGLSYEYRNIVLDARYFWGFLKAIDSNPFYNRVFQVTLGFRLPTSF